MLGEKGYIQFEGTKNIQPLLTCEVDIIFPFTITKIIYFHFSSFVQKYTHASEQNTLYSDPRSEA